MNKFEKLFLVFVLPIVKKIAVKVEENGMYLSYKNKKGIMFILPSKKDEKIKDGSFSIINKSCKKG